MRTLSAAMTVAGALSSVAATPTCVPVPDGFAKQQVGVPKLWEIQEPYIVDANDPPVPTKCIVRADGDVLSPAACATLCNSLENTAGITNAKILCENTEVQILTHQAMITGIQDYSLLAKDRKYFFWTSVTTDGTTWTDTACDPDTLQNKQSAPSETWWGDNLPGDGNQKSWDGEAGQAGNTPIDAAIWVFGQADDVGDPAGGPYGDPPYIAGITAAASNPSDVFCMCQYDPYDPPTAPACESSPFGCCDGTDTTDAKDNSLGTNCVGGAGYTNSKEVSDAFNNAIVAAAGMATGLLVAVIVIPIVGLILLIICIVCICKHCCGGKPSA